MLNRELIEKLNTLNCSNQLDTDAHRWSSLVYLFDISTEDDADPEYIARRANREGLRDAADVKREMTAVLAKKISELSAILAELNAAE